MEEGGGGVELETPEQMGEIAQRLLGIRQLAFQADVRGDRELVHALAQDTGALLNELSDHQLRMLVIFMIEIILQLGQDGHSEDKTA